MKLSRRSTLADVVAVVAGALDGAGLRAVLTGGACATLYSDGSYQSHDLDFVMQSPATRSAADQAMASIGFTRQGDRYVHDRTPLFVEFVRGPLAIGQDLTIRPVRLAVGTGSTWALSPTDACRDRLAAFFHWADRQSLTAAVAIARRQRVSMASLRRWSAREGAQEKFEEFRRAVRGR